MPARFAVACQSRSHALLLLQALEAPPADIAFAVESAAHERFLRKLGCQVVRGSLRDRATYRALLPAGQLIVSLRDIRRLRGVLEAIHRERGETPVIVLSMAPLSYIPFDCAAFPWARVVASGDVFAPILRDEIRFAAAKVTVRKMREALGDAKNAAILLQDDPDPDSLASGLALRTLLGRNRTTMPMVSFGSVTRPENLEMMRLLDLDIQVVNEGELAAFERIAMVDTQPPHLRLQPPRVDVVIDHHPAQTSYEARFKDVRNGYGATATILVEYLRAEGTKVNERLATALLYAIRTDTLLLDRPVADADVEAFTWLYARANINQIRRIERPSLPRETLLSFADGLREARIEEKVVFSHLGAVVREDIIPQLADFCLQVEGVDWSVVSGVVGSELIVCVRNVGFVQKAGAVLKAAFGDIGPAGGHRSMAKAILPLEALPQAKGAALGPKTYRALEDRFLAALKSQKTDKS
ncbi:MAG TPA: DHH family phosphoesterase [Acidobacteriota bacterium]|nr:DHH family phosphoesterase [Acidobacteriota bacterium]